MSLRALALQEFDLPAAPQRIDELPPPGPDMEVLQIQAPAGRFLLICGAGALSLAFEATLFDLLAESRYPAPRPRRSKGGGLIAKLDRPGGHAGAACYPVGAGEQLDPADAASPQLLEVGRLLARLHQLGEAHPAPGPPAPGERPRPSRFLPCARSFPVTRPCAGSIQRSATESIQRSCAPRRAKGRSPSSRGGPMRWPRSAPSKRSARSSCARQRDEGYIPELIFQSPSIFTNFIRWSSDSLNH